MSRNGVARLEAAPRWLYMAPGGEPELEAAAAWLRLALPRLDWRAHLLTAWPEMSPGIWGSLLEAAVSHLERRRFVTLTLHPVIAVSAATAGDDGWPRRLLAATAAFQEEAYEEQSDARLQVLPILAPAPGLEAERLLGLAEELRVRLATPTLLVDAGCPGRVVEAAVAAGMRVITPPPADDVGGLLGRLGEHHVVDSLLERVDDGGGRLLTACRRHLVVDPATGHAFGCLRGWREGRNGVPLDGALFGPGGPPLADCAACVPASLEALGPDLVRNGRRGEGRTLALETAVELAGCGEHGAAASLAAVAAGLADSDPDRAPALLLEGICRVAVGRPREAEEALVAAGAAGADPGVVAYHRGRAQMAWRDEIEALERFAESLESSSPAVPVAEVHLAMAQAHVNIGEHTDALPHLELAAGAADRAAVPFLRGVARLGLGEAGAARADLEEALRLGPAPEDEERVRLWLATSLKDLGRHEEAVAALEPVAARSQELALHNLLGFCRYSLGRHAEAVASFRRALDIDPRSALDWSNLAANLRELGRHREAVDAYRRALELDPGLQLALAGLARTRRLAMDES